MASVVWLIVWLVKGTPNLEWFGSWNDWAVALLAASSSTSSAVVRPARGGARPVAETFGIGREH